MADEGRQTKEGRRGRGRLGHSVLDSLFTCIRNSSPRASTALATRAQFSANAERFRTSAGVRSDDSGRPWNSSRSADCDGSASSSNGVKVERADMVGCELWGDGVEEDTRRRDTSPEPGMGTWDDD